MGRRTDLNELLVEMIGEMQVGHNRIGGGDLHREKPVNVGLLGADIRFENGAYRVTRVFDGENWNPFLKAPLAAPGIGLGEGDYVLSVNGRKIGPKDNFFSYFANTVGKQVTLEVGDKDDMTKTRDVVVEPIANEAGLRKWAWVENNRKYVEEKSGGTVGYVYLPNTGGGGFRYFNRMFYAQVDKPGMIIDERQNGGGQAANYITDVLGRTYLSSWKDRDGLIFDTPGGAVYGPKVMLIDQDAGSGGDFLPFSFKYMGLGKLIGTRTWGGLIGISTNPQVMDGGFLTVPFFRTFSAEGKWFIENEGVAPDIEVELESADVNRGIDTQLDRAILEVMNQLKTYKPVKQKVAPAMPTEVGK